MSQGDTDAVAGLAHGFASPGQKANAEKLLRDLEERSKKDYVSAYMIATIYAVLGRKDQAFGWMEKAYRERSPDIAYFIKADLRVDKLRSDPRYLELVRRIGLPQ